MNILYHHRTQGKAVEGVHIRGIANALRKADHSVQIISFPGADPEAPVTNAGQPKSSAKTKLLGFISGNLPEFAFEALEMVYNLYTLIRLNSVIQKGKVDYIYERYSLFLFATVWLAQKRGVPIVLEINDSASLPRVRPLLFRSLAARIEAWVLKNADGLVFISDYFVDSAKHNYGEIAPYVISPNAADIEQFSPSEELRNTTRSRYGVDNKVVCGFIGAFLPWHGIADFLATMAPRLKENTNLVFLLVGDGPQFDEAKSTVAAAGVDHQVIFTGRVAHTDVPGLMCAMDFSILPDSNEYGSPMKLFESMAMAVPMVCPDYSPITDIVEDGRTGWVFKAGQQNEAVEAVLRVSRLPLEVEEVASNAREYIIKSRQWSHNVEQLMQLYPTI